MIVSYETLRTLSTHLAQCSIGLLLCDEGHRLKNSGRETQIIRSCSLILSTRLPHFSIFARIGCQAPSNSNGHTDTSTVLVLFFPQFLTDELQNDLSEYFSLLDFANPNFLGSKGEFRKNFENAIIRGRDASASDTVKEASEKKLKELGGLVTKFIIRRTNDLLSKYRSSFHSPIFSDYVSLRLFAPLSQYSACEIRAGRLLRVVRLPTVPIPLVHIFA